MLCKFCRWAHTSVPSTDKTDGYKYPAATWCANNQFDEREAYDDFPEIYECKEYDLNPDLTLEDVNITLLVETVKEINRLYRLKASLNKDIFPDSKNHIR